MSKKLLLAVFLALFTPLPLTTFAQTVFPLSESFENGIPDTWTIEYVNTNADESHRISWTTEKGDAFAYPEGVVDGEYRAVFRNTTGVEMKCRTRLVSPVFDPTEWASPVLCFSYATPRWNGAFDTLYVKYRNVENGDEPWLNLYRITSHANTWQTDTVDLIAWTEKYQIAFEAVDHLGRGVVLDNIVVRPRPQCVTPYALGVGNITASSAQLVWSAGFAQDGFQLLLSSRKLFDYELDDSNFTPDMGKKELEGDALSYTVENLKPGQKVYWYIRTICADDNTEWVEGDEVRIPNQIAVPFTQDFNVETCEEGSSVRIENWYYGNSFGGEVPLVNCYQNEWNLDATSKDDTYSLVFGVDAGAGYRGRYDAIDADEWAYIATPELIVDHMALVQLQFDATTAGTMPAAAAQIQIGVMSDPNDLKTFELITTVDAPVTDPEFAVSFAAYEGTAKHIAILSRSSESNRFSIDNIHVSLAPDCPKARDVEFLFPSSQSVVVDWSSATATTGQIYICSSMVAEDQLETSTDVIRKVEAPTIPFTVTNDGVETGKLEAGKTYYLYVRNKCEADKFGAWSKSARLVMPNAITTLPQSKMDLFDDGEFTVLPELSGIDLKDVEVQFVASGSAVVGVLDTVGSITSFTFVEQTMGDEASIRKVVFDTYEGDGRFIAIKGTVSEVKLRYKSNCTLPENLTSTPTENSALLSWKGAAGAQFEVRASLTDDYSKLEDASYTGYVFCDTVATDNVTLENLKTANTAYYWWVRSVCTDTDGETQTTTYSDWTLTSTFSTLCPTKNKLPYILDFENNWNGGLEDNCISIFVASDQHCFSRFNWGLPDDYNYAISFETYPNNTSTTDIVVVFNEMEIDKIQNLLLTFKMVNRTSTSDLEKNLLSKQPLEIGVLTDKGDSSTFVKVTEVFCTDNSTVQRPFAEDFAVSFSDYKGEGKYVALRVRKTETPVKLGVFDIRFDKSSGCPKTETPQIVDVASDSVVLNWRKSLSETEWQMVAADKRLDNDQLAKALTLDPSSGPVAVGGDTMIYAVDKKVTNNIKHSVKGLQPQSEYYVYVRSNCGTDAYSPWSNPCRVLTECKAYTPEEFGVIDFEIDNFDDSWGKVCSNRPDCWTMVNTEDEDWAPIIAPEMHHSGKYSLKVASTVSERTSTEYTVSYAIMPELDVDDISDYRMTFYGSCGINDFETITQWNACQAPALPRAQSIIVGVTSSLQDLSRFRAVDTVLGFSTWQPYTVSFRDYTGDDYAKGKYVVFMSEFDMNNVFYIDDISFERVEDGKCAAPIALDTVASTGSSLTLTWKGEVAPYNVRLSDRQLSSTELAMTTLDGVTDIANVTDTFVLLDNLVSDEQYYAYVSSTCDGKAAWSAPLHFSLQCPEYYTLPYHTNFDKDIAGEGIVPNCWTGLFAGFNNEQNRYPHVIDKGKSGNALYVYAAYNVMSYAILPQLGTGDPTNRLDLTKCVVSFDAIGDATPHQRSVIVGIVTDMASDVDIAKTFIPVDTVLVSGSEYQHFTVSLANTTPSAERIVLSCAYSENWNQHREEMGYSAGAYVDNVVVTLAGDCGMPKQVTVTDVSATEAKITVEGDAAEYALIAGTAGFTPNTADAVKIGKEHTVALTGVTDIYVAGYCDGKAGELKYGPITIRPVTGVVDVTSDFTDNFDNTDLWSFGGNLPVNHWALAKPEGSENNAMFISNDGTKATYNSSVSSYAWAYRTLNLKAGVYTFSYRKMAPEQTETAFVRFGLLPVTASFNSGDARIMDNSGALIPLTLTNTPAGWLNIAGSDTALDKMTDIVYEMVISNDLAGKYNLVAYWQNGNEGTEVLPSAVIGNLNIAYQPCVAPYDLVVDKISHDTATLAWKEVKVEGIDRIGFEVFVTSDTAALVPELVKDDALFKKTYSGITETSTAVKELPADMPLRAFVRVNCSADADADGNSPWSEPIDFTTLCAPVDTTGLAYNFDGESDLIPLGELKSKWNDDYTGKIWYSDVNRPGCFINGHIDGKDADAYAPLAYYPSSYGMARSGSYCLSLNRNTGIAQKDAGGYIAVPLLDADYNGMQMVFWMRAVCTATSYEDGSKYFYSSSDALDPTKNAMSITLGTMTDPNDPTTLEKIRVYKYPYTNEDITNATFPADDPNGNEFWVKYVVPLDKYAGKYIVFLNDDYGVKRNMVYIDDISFEPYNGCMQPQNLKPLKATSDSIVMTFEHETGDEWFVTVSSMKNMKDTLQTKVVNTDTFSITGLEQNTKYYVTVSQVCGENLKSDPSMVQAVMTNRGLRYEETFSEDKVDPTDWLRTNGAIDIESLLSGNETMTPYIRPNFSDMGWAHAPLSEHMSAHQYRTIEGNRLNNGAFWNISPLIYIREGQEANLTFDLAVTLMGTNDPLVENDLKAIGNTFVIAISVDGGTTYLRENAFIWGNNPTEDNDFEFSSISNTFTRFSLDISKHMDKNIRIAFTTQSTADAVNYDLHIDNIIVNTMDIIDINENLCAKEDYVGNGFDIPYEELKVGEVYKKERYDLSTTNESDKLYRLQLTVDSPIEKVEDITVCQSALPYTDANGFYATESGSYSKHFEREGQCDSTYTVNLTVVPPVTTIIRESMCSGGEYVFNGKTLTEKGVYNDTLFSTVTKCDSIVTLILDVSPAKEYMDTVIVCFGETYKFGEKELSASGDYTETFYEGECDSIVKLHLIVRPEYIDIKNVAICEGDVYNDDVFKGLKQNFCDTLTRKSVDGCDSIVGLELVVIKGEEFIEIEKNITRDDLPYIYFGHTFDTDTKDGTTVTDIPVKADGDKCEGTIRLTLNVGENTKPEDAVENVRVHDMALTPNPVMSGATVILGVELAADERDGAVVEVFNAMGSLVETLTPSTVNPITINCNYTSGIYIVRLTTSGGKVYQGKIVVK